MKDTLVVLGGIVPQEDIPKLKEQGVAAIFLPGTSTQEIVKFFAITSGTSNVFSVWYMRFGHSQKHLCAGLGV